MRKILLLILILILSGCSAFGKPEIVEYKNSWGEITNSYSEMITYLKINNPNPFPISIKSIKVNLFMNGIKMGEGRTEDITLKAMDITDLKISTKIDNTKIPEWWITHIKNGEKSKILVDGKIILKFGIMEFEIPFKEETEIKTDILNSSFKGEMINLMNQIKASINAEWGKVDRDNTEIIAHITFSNSLSTPIKIKKVTYKIMMNDITVGSGTIEKEMIIKRGETDYDISVYIDNSKLSKWWISHLRNGERTKVRIKIELLSNIFGSEVNLELINREFSLTTNIV